MFSLYIHQLMDIWDCFQVLPIMNDASINIYIQAFVWYIFISLEYITNNRIAGSYGSSVFPKPAIDFYLVLSNYVYCKVYLFVKFGLSYLPVGML